MSYYEYYPIKHYKNEHFSPDYIRDNPVIINIISPDNKFEPLSIYTIKQGSIKLKQTLCSESYFLWGGMNASELEFECCTKDMVDKSPDGLIQLRITPTRYEKGKLKEVLTDEGVNLFTGYIEGAEKTKLPGMWKITAYDRLYRMRNVKCSSWLNSYVKTLISGGQHVSWNDICSFVETQLGFGTCIHPDWMSEIYFPDNTDIVEQNGVDLLKQFAFFMQAFGMVDGDGHLQYIQVQDSNNFGESYYAICEFDPENLTYESGHIWLPKLFTSEPRTNIFYTTGETTPDADYYNNIYTVKNSALLGNEDWIEQMYECDAYGAPSSKYNAANMPKGLFDTRRLCLTNGEEFSQQQYSIKCLGDPTIEMGSLLFIDQMGRDDAGNMTGWKQLVRSYIMERTITFISTQCIQCEYSANNEPYNSVVPEHEYGVQNANALANLAYKNLPFIVDGSSLTKLKAIRSISADDYKNLTSDEKRSDTIFYVRGEVSSS